MEKETYPTTPKIRELLRIVIDLEESKTVILKPIGLFRNKYDAESMVFVTKEVARAKAKLWEQIYATYEITKSGTWNVDFSEITRLEE